MSTGRRFFLTTGKHVSPLYRKKKKPVLFDQLRLISRTPLISRTLESFVAKWVVVEDISIHVDEKQFENVKGCPTVQYLVYLIKFVLEGLEPCLSKEYGYLISFHTRERQYGVAQSLFVADLSE